MIWQLMYNKKTKFYNTVFQIQLQDLQLCYQILELQLLTRTWLLNVLFMF